jgi:hypothetical protein
VKTSPNARVKLDCKINPDASFVKTSPKTGIKILVANCEFVIKSEAVLQILTFLKDL